MTAVHNAPATGWRAECDDAVIALTVSAQGLVAIAGAAGTAWVLDADDGTVCATLGLPGGLLDVAFSPDGAHLALVGPLGYALWHTAGGPMTVCETGAWSARARWAGSDRLAVASGRRVRVLDAQGRQLWQTAAAPSTVTDLAWLHSGRRLALCAYGGVYCHERHRAEQPVVEYRYTDSHLALAAAPTGRWICTGNQDATIHIWRTRDGEELTMSGYPDKIGRLAFDDTGRWLAADGAGEVSVWDFAGKGPADTMPRLLRAHQAISALAWRPGAAAVLASGGREGILALWRVAGAVPGKPRRPARQWDTGAPIAALAWHRADVLLTASRCGMLQARHVGRDAGPS